MLLARRGGCGTVGAMTRNRPGPGPDHRPGRKSRRAGAGSAAPADPAAPADEWVVLAHAPDAYAARERAMARLSELGATVRRTARGPYVVEVAAEDLRIDLLCTRGSGCFSRWSIRRTARDRLVGAGSGTGTGTGTAAGDR